MRTSVPLLACLGNIIICAPLLAAPDRTREQHAVGRMAPAYHASLPEDAPAQVWVGLGGPGISSEALLEALEAGSEAEGLAGLLETLLGRAPETRRALVEGVAAAAERAADADAALAWVRERIDP